MRIATASSRLARAFALTGVASASKYAPSIDVMSTVAASIRVDRVASLIVPKNSVSRFVAIPEGYLAPVPAGVSLERASTLPMSGLTALAAVRDLARLGPGRSMLLQGATGGVGVLAVQIARKLGASVTAVASARHHAALERLGATHTIDYRKTPVSELEGPFDAVLDFSTTLRMSEVAHLLAPEGVFIPADPIRNLRDVLFSRRTRWLMVDRGDGPRLRELGQWVADGDLELVLDEVFPLSHWEQAVERGHARGRIGRTVLAFR